MSLPIELRISEYIRNNTQSGKVVADYPVPGAELANFMKKIEEFKNHSTIALTMLLMNARLVALEKGESFQVKDSS